MKVLLMVALMAFPCWGQSIAIQAASKNNKTAFTLSTDYLPVVECSIGGHKYRCALDTGATVTYIPTRENAGHLTTVKLVTSTGSVDVKEGVSSVKLEGQEYKVLVAEQDLPASMPYDVILGENFLQQFSSITIDYKKHVIILTK